MFNFRCNVLCVCVHTHTCTCTVYVSGFASFSLLFLLNFCPSSPDKAVLPVVNAGPDIAITLPTNTAILNGSLSLDGFGIKSYHWSRSGDSPAAGEHVTHTRTHTHVGALFQAIYVLACSASTDIHWILVYTCAILTVAKEYVSVNVGTKSST